MFFFVLTLDTIFLASKMFKEKVIFQNPVFLALDKLSEETTFLIIYHFVLDLLPVCVVIGSETSIAKQIKTIEKINKFYAWVMVLAVANSLLMFASRTYAYYTGNINDYTPDGINGVIDYSSTSVNFLLDLLIVSLFVMVFVRILAARKRMTDEEDLTAKQKFSIALVVTLTLFFLYYIISFFIIKSAAFWAEEVYLTMIAWNILVIYKFINFSFAMGLLFLFVSMSLQKLNYE